MSASDRALDINVSKQALDGHLQPDDHTWQVPNTDDRVRRLTRKVAELSQ